MKLNALHLLEQKDKTTYWLHKQLGMSYQSCDKMLKNETKSIRYDTLEALCKILDCTPNDLFTDDDEQV